MANKKASTAVKAAVPGLPLAKPTRVRASKLVPQHYEPECVAVETQVERLRRLAGSEIPALPPEPDWDHTLSSSASGVQQLSQQFEILRDEIRALKSTLRPYLPDHLYEETLGDKAIGLAEGFAPAGNLNSPLLHALAELLDEVTDIRASVRHLSHNIVY